MPAADRYQQIVVAAMREFARTGYSGTTTAHIASTIGVSQPYVMRLVRTKRDLFLAAFDHACQTMEDLLRDAVGDLGAAASAEARLDALRAAGYHGVLADRDLMGMMLHAFAAAGADEQVRDVVRVRYERLFATVAEVTGGSPAQVRDLMAVGLLWQVIAVLGAAGPSAEREWATPIPW
ncbi:TetR/AcrR family transcriptional regulator [Actinokineospora guangxiensis]|uniref:TetR/AcrR family transcriptional regulator n=1 Tax=Actinokineospora guangxiensis TaxID=1490288 RepID=A0ABW0ERV6_9PSEU